MIAALFLLLGLGEGMALAQTQSNTPGQWPQWRGPDGLGVSTDGNLPEKWNHDSANIKWKTSLPGEGCSSPIVSGNRVFVTTAYENAKPPVVRRACIISLYVLTIVFFAALLLRLVLHLKKKDDPDKDPNEDRSLGRVLGVVLAVISTALFFALAVALYIFPERYDASIGAFLAKILGTYDTEHVFYINKNVAAATWLNTGAVALLGFAAALSWLRIHSIWRLLGTFVLAALAVAFVVATPMDAWKYTIVLWTRLLFLVPAALVAIWNLLGYPQLHIGGSPQDQDKGSALKSINQVRISLPKKNICRPGGLTAVVLFLSLTALAALVFVPVNLVLPKMGMHRAVLCVDFATGKILWHTPVFTAPAERKHRDATYATPTPATDGRHVVAHFGAGTVCLDFEGRILWKAMDEQYSDDTRYGAAASVLIHQDKAIVLQEREENTKRRTWLAAFDIASGDVSWKVTPSHLHQAYTTGILHDDGSGVKLVIATYKAVFCFDAESGRLLWKHDIPMEQIVASAAREDALFCVGGGTWGPSGLIAFTVAEGQMKDPVREQWHATENTPGCASPVMYDGMVFTITDTGVMRAYDAASGTVHWEKRLGGRFLASLVAGDGKIYACNTRAVTTVIAAQPRLQILAKNKLQGDCRASFAVADSRFLIRTADFLYCIAPNTATPSN